jgi:hypothetical protein
LFLANQALAAADSTPTQLSSPTSSELVRREVNASERTYILNVGGFSDAVFAVVLVFFCDAAARFVAEVEAIEL